MSGFQYLTNTGVIVADTSDILGEVNAEWQAAFGADLDVDPSTPQGIMIAAEVSARTLVMQTMAQLANQFNPQQATDVFLDADCALMGLQRIAATYTNVTSVTMGGVPQRSIPAGARAKTAAGDVFALAGGVTFDNTGTAYGTFIAQESGPVPCANGELNQIVDNILGWETVTNNQSGTPTPSVTTLGALQQTDSSLKVLRNNTLAQQGISTEEAQISGLYALSGVTSVSYRQNMTGSTAVIDGITLVAHSVWACVDGGTDLDIATSLLKNKTDGAAWNGAQSVVVVEPASGQSYTVLFDRPTYEFTYQAVTASQGSYPGNLQTDIPQAIVDYYAGNIAGFSNVGNGDSVSPFEMAAAIATACPGCMIQSVAIGSAPNPTSMAVYPIALNQRAQTSVSATNVTVSS